MTPLLYMSADAPVFAAARLLQDKVPRAVLEEAEVSGTVDYKDLSKLPLRVLFFGLVLEFEDLANRVVMNEPVESWYALREDYRVQAIGRYMAEEGQSLKPAQIREKYALYLGTRPAKLGAVTPAFRRDAASGRKIRIWGLGTALEIMMHLYLQYVSLSARISLILRRNLLSEIPRQEVKRVLNLVKKLRNACVHPRHCDWDTFEPVEKRDCWQDIQDIHRMMAAMVRAYDLDDET